MWEMEVADFRLGTILAALNEAGYADQVPFDASIQLYQSVPYRIFLHWTRPA
jgi:hypothetical protein